MKKPKWYLDLGMDWQDRARMDGSEWVLRYNGEWRMESRELSFIVQIYMMMCSLRQLSKD